MAWQVLETRSAAKALKKLPKRIGLIYAQLVEDLEEEGPMPLGWDVKKLKGEDCVFRVRLTREYRAIIEVLSPNIIVLRVTHRREAYR